MSLQFADSSVSPKVQSSLWGKRHSLWDDFCVFIGQFMYLMVMNHRNEPLGKKGFILVSFLFSFSISWKNVNGRNKTCGFCSKFYVDILRKVFPFFFFF